MLVREKLLGHESFASTLDEYVQTSLLDQRITRLDLARRVSRLAGMVHLTDALSKDLAARSFSWPAEIKNAIVRLLPAQDRRAAFERLPARLQSTHEVAGVPAHDSARSGEQGPLTDNAILSSRAHSLAAEEASSQLADYSTVLLLGARDAHAANASLLRHEYSPEFVSSLLEFRDSLATRRDFCGFIVDESFTSALDAEMQEEFFTLLGSYSTLTWIRMCCGAATVPTARIRQLLLASRHDLSDLPSSQVCFADSRTITERELPDLAAARDQLNDAARTRLHVKGVHDLAGQLLAVTISREVVRAAPDEAPQNAVIDVEFIQRGFTGTTVAIVQHSTTDTRRLVKVGKKDYALDEARRFRKYIRAWDPQLQPTLVFHADTGLIAFHAISDGTNVGGPARTLKAQLEQLWNDQYMSSGAQSATASLQSQLEGSVRVVASALAALSVRKATEPEDYSYVNPTESPFLRLEASGFDWGLPNHYSTARTSARERVRVFERVAVVHGDLHLKNILVNEAGGAYLIDYAASGPGHPCVDLIRLELALLFEQFRLVTSVAEFTELFLDLHRGELAEREVLNKYPHVVQCRVNAVCVLGAVHARKHAVKTIEAFGGTANSYADAKLLALWQSMAMHGRQAALCRAAIEALSDLIERP